MQLHILKNVRHLLNEEKEKLSYFEVSMDATFQNTHEFGTIDGGVLLHPSCVLENWSSS
jgi:hypothetical protein